MNIMLCYLYKGISEDPVVSSLVKSHCSITALNGFRIKIVYLNYAYLIVLFVISITVNETFCSE